MSPYRLEVTCDEDGSVTIKTDAYTAATLGGRDGFRDTAAIQGQLVEAIADAWYAADCPRW